MRERQKEAAIALDIVEHSPSIALRVTGDNGDWNIQFITENIREFGYDRADFLEGRLAWADIVHPDDLGELVRQLDEYAEQRIDVYCTRYRIVDKSGQEMWVQDNSTITRDAAGNVLYADCIISDHTEIEQNRAKIEDNLRQQRVLNDILQGLQSTNLDDAFQVILDRTGAYLDISRVVLFEDDENHNCCRAVYEWDNQGISRMMDQGDFSLCYSKDIPEIEKDLNTTGMRVVHCGQVPAGSAREFAHEGVIAAAIFAVYHGGRRYGFICFDECVQPRMWEADTLAFLQNIAKLVSTALLRKSNEESIRRMAYQDQLTGLTNRYRFDVHLKHAIADARTAGKEGYVLFIDMDDFKIINDGYGHDYGDSMLIEVSTYLQTAFAECCRVFRFGGDEFLLLLEWPQADQMQYVVDAILERGRHPWTVRDREFYCTISIGVVRFPDGNDTATDVIKKADIAMYRAKSLGKNNYAIYNRGLDNQSYQRAETEHKMRESIENDFFGFRVFYQPLVNLDGEVIGAEALMRWMDKDGNVMSPAEFIPLAEYLGLIVPLGEFVLREAALQCRRINETFPRFFMSINVSIRQFQQSDFLERAERILEQTGVDISNIVLEVTEGMVVQDLQNMKLMMEDLRMMGLKIAMDDFGTGYSSLNNMRELPLDIIKIDRTFIRDVTSDAYSKSFIRLITDLGHSMGRNVCVEGVETMAQYRYCADCDVDYIQGYFFHKPMPEADLRDVIRREQRKLMNA